MRRYLDERLAAVAAAIAVITVTATETLSRLPPPACNSLGRLWLKILGLPRDRILFICQDESG